MQTRKVCSGTCKTRKSRDWEHEGCKYDKQNLAIAIWFRNLIGYIFAHIANFAILKLHWSIGRHTWFEVEVAKTMKSRRGENNITDFSLTVNTIAAHIRRLYTCT